MQQRLPFSVSKTESFFDKLNEWIGDVFYDILPEAGLELRDEQIFMAFQLEQAFKQKEVVFAEAGVGTGKTLAYLLSAICYARYRNEPAIISCADETLIEQLVKKEGDIAKLENILGLQIDVRLAKSRDQYICLNKLDEALLTSDNEEIAQMYDDLPEFLHSNQSMQTFEHYGDRKDYPRLSDQLWKLVSWDPLQDCFTCEKRHRCGQTLHRSHYRAGKELIICSHDFFMEHVWTEESRKREGQLPLLPNSSCVIFDEGHLLEDAAQKALTYRISERMLEELLIKLRANDVREVTLLLIEQIIDTNELFFSALASQVASDYAIKKQAIRVGDNEEIQAIGKQLHEKLQQLEEELVFESQFYVINEYDLKVVEEYIEQMTYSLSLFLKKYEGISWLEAGDGERILVIMPRLVQDILKNDVFSVKKPYIFSSATLSTNDSFDYMSASLGISDYYSFSVPSPFDYEANMQINLRKSGTQLKEKFATVAELINEGKGGTLVLFANEEERNEFKQFVLQNKAINHPFFVEGDQEISKLVQQFQQVETAVLCSNHLWEGLDVPGAALENIIIFSLPFPADDPVFTAKREIVENPFWDVDMPYMLLRLRQGVGRLIRTHTDKGTVHIFLEEEVKEEVVESILQVLPVTPQMK